MYRGRDALHIEGEASAANRLAGRSADAVGKLRVNH
jgi:hypothetical protein